MIPLKSYICGCARNCKEFLPKVFINIEKIIELLDDFHIVIAFDMSNDATLHELYEWRIKFRNKMTILHNNQDLSYLRVKNISNARNRILRYIEEDNEHADFHYFINMDMDDVCASPININVLGMPRDLGAYTPGSAEIPRSPLQSNDLKSDSLHTFERRLMPAQSLEHPLRQQLP